MRSKWLAPFAGSTTTRAISGAFETPLQDRAAYFISAVHHSRHAGILRNVLMVSISIGDSKINTIIDAIRAIDDSDRPNLIERPWLNSIKGG
jgi:hypothetical protein